MVMPSSSTRDSAGPDLAAGYMVNFLEESARVRAAALPSWHREGHIAERVVLRHGGLPSSRVGVPVVSTPALAVDMVTGPAGQCFENAHHAASAELLYTEGWAASLGPAGVPVHHAWLTASDGRIYDPTWAGRFEDAATCYLGVRFSHEFTMQHRADWGATAVLERNMRLLERGLVFGPDHVATGYPDAG
jgi:hypothetical protein